MSDMYPTIKQYYELEIFSKEEVAEFVTYNWITAEEYQLITDEAYVAA
jgi:uncharacterized XkdX family phage protein